MCVAAYSIQVFLNSTKPIEVKQVQGYDVSLCGGDDNDDFFRQSSLATLSIIKFDDLVSCV